MKKNILIEGLVSLVLVASLFMGISNAVTVGVTPYPRFQAWYPGTSTPLLGGFLYSCVPGTTCGCSAPANPKTTYTDSTGTAMNTNPITLDSSGQADVWLSGYTKLTLCDPSNNLIWSKDNINSIAQASSSTASSWIAQTGPFTYQSATSFSVAGNQTSIYVAGLAIQGTDGGGTYTGIIVSSAYTSSTLVTVVWSPSQQFNNTTISAISLGFTGVGPMTKAVGIEPVLKKTANYTLTANDINQTIEFNGSNALAGTWTNQAGTVYSIALATLPSYVFNSTTQLTYNFSPNSTLIPSGNFNYAGGNLYVNIGGNPTGGNIVYNLIVTLPAASAVPSGSWYRLKCTGGPGLTINGTVDGLVNPIVGRTGASVTVVSDGTSWYYGATVALSAPDQNLTFGALSLSNIVIGADRLTLSDVSGRVILVGPLSNNSTSTQSVTLDIGGSFTNTTWYYIWLLAKPDGTLKLLASTSSNLSGVSLPAGYVFGLLVSAAENSGTNSTLGIPYNYYQVAKEVRYAPIQNMLTLTTGSPTDTAYTPLHVAGTGITITFDKLVPPISRMVYLQATVNPISFYIGLSLDGGTPYAATDTGSGLAFLWDNGSGINSIFVQVPLATPQQLWFLRSTATSTSVWINVAGFTLP